MFKKFCVLVMVFCFSFSVFSQDMSSDSFITVSGSIEKVDTDSGYIIVDGTKISANKDFIDNAYFEVGDEVSIFAEKDEGKLTAVDYEYQSEDDTADEQTQEDISYEETTADYVE